MASLLVEQQHAMLEAAPGSITPRLAPPRRQVPDGGRCGGTLIGHTLVRSLVRCRCRRCRCCYYRRRGGASSATLRGSTTAPTCR